MNNLFKVMIILFGISISVYGGYTVECTGENQSTNYTVSGECTDGYFEGEDEHTGSSVSGYCEFGGSFDGQDDRTGERVEGYCNGE